MSDLSTALWLIDLIGTVYVFCEQPSTMYCLRCLYIHEYDLYMYITVYIYIYIYMSCMVCSYKRLAISDWSSCKTGKSNNQPTSAHFLKGPYKHTGSMNRPYAANVLTVLEQTPRRKYKHQTSQKGLSSMSTPPWSLRRRPFSSGGSFFLI